MAMQLPSSANEHRLVTLESGIKSFRQWHHSANEIKSKSSSHIESFRFVRRQYYEIYTINKNKGLKGFIQKKHIPLHY